MLYQQDADRLLEEQRARQEAELSRLLEEQRARQEAELSGQKQAFSLLALLVHKYKY